MDNQTALLTVGITACATLVAAIIAGSIACRTNINLPGHYIKGQ